MISHCGATSNRDTYIADLQRYFPVDLSGKCGDGLERNIDDYLFSCPSKTPDFCRDYVTEKAFIPYAHGTVPVVLGMGNYSALLPAHSYIDVADFASPKELGERLRFLSEHPEEYRKYFAWADSEEPYHRPERYRKGRSDICKLCEMVSGHASGLHRRHSSYADLNEWWVTRAKCFSPMNSRRTLVDPLLRVVANLCSFRILKTLLLC
ncbi:putative Glycoprotein 3-alpha-L-fucosyltransferase A [Hypsibius exemplaris]|uniref:Fucosyltransferase n=1 Tax=Hypsibius exemplaris TaxID=2072580 RepID=A0A1W0WYL1_HYPEX|nr:putative Glycoprotein 3-alpha-L-fucosyltransferase A [Hypsibius exemplaris]